ncbi:MAG: acetylxylan esterase [Bacteroidales bacterium]|jgi:cephalosporin-C deacetylase-like acetyl esterase|nr:acetylxylan esterase [Bacteroidales bacterium]
MRILRIIIFLLILSITSPAQNLLPEKWKFKTGDDPSWAAGSYDDSGWQEITPGTNWENQGFGNYDGFAWYRVTFNVPSSLKEVAKKYGGFNLLLGRIDDVDFTYLNGELIARNGKLPPHYVTKWNVDRVNRVPAGKIRWDQPNTIAVRVFDLLGGGGIYSSPIQFSVRGVSDFLSIVPVFNETDRILREGPVVSLAVNLVNGKKLSLPGVLTWTVISDFGDEVLSGENGLVLPGKSTTPYNFSLPGIRPGFYKVNVTFKSKLAFKEYSYQFGFQPENIVSPPDRQPDFENFWKQAKQELAAVDPQFSMTRIDSLCTTKRHVYLVEMHSLGNVRVRGWYSVPAAPGMYPAIMQLPGYSGQMLPEYVDYGDDIIGFGLNIRGHGNSRDDIDPGFPGFLFYGIEDEETYIYRGAYMDCVRGIDFLFSRPEVDTTRVAVEGGSQGGALTFATAALDNDRIRACAPLVPFLSDFEDYFRVAAWPANEFLDFIEKEKKMPRGEVYRILSYIDIKNLAGWIKAPMLMGVGLVDDVCPPHINFAAYNQVGSEKQYIVYPEAGHGLPEDFYIQRMQFFNEKFGLK